MSNGAEDVENPTPPRSTARDAGPVDLAHLLGLSAAGTSLADVREVAIAVCEQAGFSDVALIRLDEEGIWHDISERVAGELTPIDTPPPGNVARRAMDQLEVQWAGRRIAAPIVVDAECWGVVCATRASDDVVDQRLETIGAAVASVLSAKKLRARLGVAEATDYLTGLPHKSYFLAQLDREMVRGNRTGTTLSVAMLDIDRYRRVSDQSGPAAADRVLARVAQMLDGVVRKDEVVARLEADAFGWILAGVGPEGARVAVERASEAVSEVELIPGRYVTLSAGIADASHATDASDLLAKAQEALNWAKVMGSGRVAHYSPSGPTVAEPSEQRAGSRRIGSIRPRGAVAALLRTIDNADAASARHAERVGELSARLAQELGWSETMTAAIRDAGVLHDVGMLAIPYDIVGKPGRLTAEEFDVVKTHAALGAEIAGKVVMPAQASWIRGHHERCEGGGYPDGLVGDDIPEGAQIIGLADAWDTMTHARSYAAALSHSEAFAEVRDGIGRQFCPKVAQALSAVLVEDADVIPVSAETRIKDADGPSQE